MDVASMCRSQQWQDCILEGVERGWLKMTPRYSISTLSLCTLAVFVTFFVLSWAGAFSIYNGWSYLDSVYFGIVTVTTIGFGDMVPEGSQLVRYCRAVPYHDQSTCVFRMIRPISIPSP
jgi:hypothetical protein